MNYYDYRSYFQQIINDLEGIQSDLDTQHTEIRSDIDDLKIGLNDLSQKLDSSISIVTVFIIISCVLRVFFK